MLELTRAASAPDCIDRPVEVVVDPLAVDLVFALRLLTLGRVGGPFHRVFEQDLAFREARRGDASGLGDLFLLRRAQRLLPGFGGISGTKPFHRELEGGLGRVGHRRMLYEGAAPELSQVNRAAAGLMRLLPSVIIPTVTTDPTVCSSFVPSYKTDPIYFPISFHLSA